MRHFYSKITKKPKWFQIITFAVLSLIAITVMGILFGFVIMLLWNALMPQIFNLPEISYWQGIGLFILGRILLGGIGGSSKVNPNKQWKSSSHSSKSKAATTLQSDMAHNSVKNYDGYDEWWQAEGKDAFEAYKTKKED